MLTRQGGLIRDTPSTAGNSMTGSERPSPEPLLKKEASPAALGGREKSGNALEASNALNYRIPAVLSRGMPGNGLRAFPGSFWILSGIAPGKSQPYWGCGSGSENGMESGSEHGMAEWERERERG